MTSRSIPHRRSAFAVGTAAATALVLAACGGGDDDGDDGSADGGTGPITVWTPHNTPQRMAIQEQVAADFTEETDIEVEIVGLGAPDQNQSIAAGAASGDVPDVAIIGPDQVASWSSQGLLDTETVATTLENLDESTFSEQALDLATIDGEVAAVPSDGWGELLYYRTDVFEQLDLDAPQSIEDVVAAAETIAASDLGMAGIVLGTTPADPMARENLEHIALADGCQMFDGTDVALDSPACVDAVTHYQGLAAASVAGDQDVESTRAAYLAGNAAMAFWSPHLLDEIGGLDANFPVSCAECADNPTYLAGNTGVVGALTGSENVDATGFGLTMNMGIVQGADADAARQYIEYVLNDGYIATLAMTPEGRTPVRTGTPDDPERFLTEWQALPMGADPANQRPFDEVFAPEVIEQVGVAANSFTRWGFGTENWATAGAEVTQNTTVETVNELLNGGDPAAYAATITDAVTALHQENQ